MRVLKFGGSSVGSLAALECATEIVKDAAAEGRVGIVVSALEGVTDSLIDAAKTMPKAAPESVDLFADRFLERHVNLLGELGEGPEIVAAGDALKEIASLLRRLLHGSRVVAACPPAAADQILAIGERAAVVVMSAALRRRGFEPRTIDALEYIVTDEGFGHARILYETTFERLDRIRTSEDRIIIMAGFIGRSPSGRTTTLGRNGSDHSAAVLARALHAEACEIWTNADGVYTADPRLLPKAYVLPEVSYSEAMEMVRIGPKVVHPLTFVPVMEVGIPVRVKNTFNAKAPGTWIREKAPAAPEGVRGLTVLEDVAVINVHGAGMTGTPGAASYVFSVLAAKNINLLFIAMSASERSLSFAVREADAPEAVSLLEANLLEEQKARFIQSIGCRKGLAVLSVVGDDMRGHPGIAGRIFGALADAGINIVAIAQGSLEANISCVIDEPLVPQALAAVHARFLEPARS